VVYPLKAGGKTTHGQNRFRWGGDASPPLQRMGQPWPCAVERREAPPGYLGLGGNPRKRRRYALPTNVAPVRREPTAPAPGGAMSTSRDMSVAPATYLVAEDSEAPRPASPDGAFGDNAALLPARVRNRRLLDHEPCRPKADFERRVVQVARGSPLDPRRHRLEYLPLSRTK